MSESLIKLENITKYFRIGNLQTKALDGIELQVNKGEFVSFHGPSGCGKSTLLSIIGLLELPTEGLYSLDGVDTNKLKQAARAKLRNHDIGFIFQAFNLLSDMTVFDNVELPLIYERKLDKKERRELVMNTLDEVGMSSRAKFSPLQLSGGQQQRVGIARAIVGEPKILLADEPTGNLDSHNASSVMELLGQLNAKGSTILMASHDPRIVAHGGRIVELLDGKVVDDK